MRESTLFPRDRINLFCCLLFLVLFGTSVVIDRVLYEPQSSGFLGLGTHDFIQLWTAFRLFIVDKNFYDPALIGPLEYALGWNEVTPLLVWYPPWLFTVMGPVLSLESFAHSARLWTICNIFFLVGSIRLLSSLYWRDEVPIPPIVLTLAFIPVAQCFDFGQTSLLILFFITLFVWASSRGHSFLMALSFVVLSVKPHPLYLFHFCAAIWIIRERNWKLIGYFLLLFLTLLTFTFIISPTAIPNWLHSFSSPPMHWITVTLAGFCRFSWSLITDGEVINWPVWGIPLATLVGFSCWYASRVRADPAFTIDWLKIAPPLTALSIFTAPYGFLYDHAPVVVSLFGICNREVCVRYSFLWKILLVMLVLAAIAQGNGMPDQFFFWMPFAVLVFWSRSRRVPWRLQEAVQK